MWNEGYLTTMAEDKPLKLHVSTGDVTIEVEGPVDDAETWFESLREDYLNDLDTEATRATESGIKKTEKTSNGGQTTASASNQIDTRKSLTLPEYFSTTDDPLKRDIILIIGYYLENYEGEEYFTKAEIQQRAEDAKIQLGANIPRDISDQIKSGYMAKADKKDGKDAYHLTRSGEEYVEEELNNNCRK